jgi:DNA-3-methyladenine glycosylase I
MLGIDFSVPIQKGMEKTRFKFIGPVIVYAFMQAAGIVNDHSRPCFRHREVMRLKYGNLHRRK